MGFSIGEMQGGVDHRAAFAGGLAFAGQNELAIEKQPEPFRVFARIAVVHVYPELVVARPGWSEVAAPAHRIVVAAEAGNWRNLIPIEVNVGVGAREHGLSAEVG